MQTHESARSRRGRWTVLAILVVGILAAAFAVTYWMGVVRRTWPQPEPEPAAAPAGDVEAAAKELDQLRQAYVEAREQKKLESVLQAARRFTDRYPGYAEGHIHLGQVLTDADQYDSALEAIRAALALEPDRAEEQFLAGNLALMLSRFPDAEQHLKRAIELDPHDPRFRLHLAQVYLQRQQYDQARTILEGVLAVDSSRDEAYSALSDLSAREGRIEQAILQIQRALDLVPAPPDDDLPKPRAQEVKDAERKARRVVYIRKKARLLRRDNRPAEALQVLQTLSPRDRSEMTTLEETAECYAMLGQPERAAALFEQMLVVFPEDWRLAAGAARWRLAAGDMATARRHLGTLRRINPGSPATADIEQAIQKQSAPAEASPDRSAAPNAPAGGIEAAG